MRVSCGFSCSQRNYVFWIVCDPYSKEKTNISFKNIKVNVAH